PSAPSRKTVQPVAAASSCAWPICTPASAVNGICCSSICCLLSACIRFIQPELAADIGGGFGTGNAQYIAKLTVELFFGQVGIPLIQAGRVPALFGTLYPPGAQGFQQRRNGAAVTAMKHGAVIGLTLFFILH